MTSEVDTILSAQEIKMGTDKLKEIGIPNHSIQEDENGKVKLSNQGAFEKKEESQEATAPAQETTAPVQETLATDVVTPAVETPQASALEGQTVPAETVSTNLQESAVSVQETVAPVTAEVNTTTPELNTAADQTQVSLETTPTADSSVQTETPKTDLEVSAVEAATEIMKAAQDDGEVIESIDYDRGDTLTEPAVSVSDPNGLASLDFGPKDKEETVTEEKKEETVQPEQAAPKIELPPMTETIVAQEPTGEINTNLFATVTESTATTASAEASTVTTDTSTLDATQEVVSTAVEGPQVEESVAEANVTIPASDMVVADNPFIAPPIENPVEAATVVTQTEELQTNTSVTEGTIEAAPVEEKVEEASEEAVAPVEKENNVSVFETLDDTSEKEESAVPVLEESSDEPSLTLPEMEKVEGSSLEAKMDTLLSEFGDLKELIISNLDLKAVSSDTQMVEAAHEPNVALDLPTLDSSIIPGAGNDSLAQTDVVSTADQVTPPAQGPVENPVDDNMIMGGKFM